MTRRYRYSMTRARSGLLSLAILAGVLCGCPFRAGGQETGDVGAEEPAAEEETLEERDVAGEAEEVVVTGTRTERALKDTPVRTEVVNKETIEESGSLRLYDLLEKQVIPGVQVQTSCTNCGFAELRMQGLEGGYSMLLIDGMPLYSALAGVYGLRQLMSENIERIEVVKGAGSCLYGSSAIGGVINIITKEPVKGKPSLTTSATYGQWDTYNLGGTASMRTGDVAAVVSAQKSSNDFVDDNGDGWSDKVELSNEYLSFKVHKYMLEDGDGTS